MTEKHPNTKTYMVFFYGIAEDLSPGCSTMNLEPYSPQMDFSVEGHKDKCPYWKFVRDITIKFNKKTFSSVPVWKRCRNIFLSNKY